MGQITQGGKVEAGMDDGVPEVSDGGTRPGQPGNPYGAATSLIRVSQLARAVRVFPQRKDVRS